MRALSTDRKLLSDFIRNILICVLKMNELGLTGLEQHEDE